MIIELDHIGTFTGKPDQFDGKNHGFWLRCSHLTILHPSIDMNVRTLLSREYKKEMGQREKAT